MRIVDDSRKVKKGDMFVAIKGLHVDSHKFIPEVIKKGVSVIVGEIEPKKEWLKKMVDEGCEYAVLEVTSHGLDQERVAGINFEIGVLTNITHEHLDYHKTFENYLRTKIKLFERSKLSILNKNDKSFTKIKKWLGKKKKIIGYSGKGV